jgi:hypothetical protein
MTVAVKEVVQTVPRILARRATCLGIQYTIADATGTHIVTVNNGCIGCSCNLDHQFLTCEHLTLVEQQEHAYIEEAARRAAYTEAFTIS